MNVLGYHWRVDLHPRGQWARWLLAAPLLPFVALEALARRVTTRRPYPLWVQLVLAVPALLCLGLPTRLYELVGLVVVREEQEEPNANVPAA